MLNTISLTYPESGLTVNVSVYVKGSATLDNSGVATETGTTKTYIYEFTGDVNTDYIYLATVTGYQDIGGAIFSNNGIVNDIWGAKISDYSGSAGTFATKFEQYGGVSHVIHDSKGAELSVEEKELIKNNKEILDKVVKQLDSTITKDEIIQLIKTIKPESKTNIVTNPINIAPITTGISDIKTSIKGLLDKKDSHSEVAFELLAEGLPEMISKFDSISEGMETILSIFNEYEKLLNETKKDRDNYKRIVTELTK